MFMVCSKGVDMSQDLQTTATQSLASPDELRELLSPPPVLGSEDDRAYGEIVGRLTQALAPRDFFEQLLVRELADCTWEMARYRRQKTLTMERGFDEDMEFPAHEALDELEEPSAEEGDETTLADAVEEAQCVEQPDAIDFELDHARALRRALIYHERLDRLLITTSNRRDEVLGVLERYRIGLGQWSREVSDRIIAAEPVVVEAEPKQIAAAPLVPSDEQAT
jgi:hypothetical protein